MLPAVDAQVLDANPKFEALYRDLCTTKLNNDGSTKLDVRAQKDHEIVVEKLYSARSATAKKDLIKSGLSFLAYSSNELPDELHELVAIILAALETPLSSEDASLLRDDMQKFEDSLPTIGPLLAKTFEQDHAALLRIAAPPPSTHTDAATDALAAWIATTQARVHSDEANQHAQRLALAHAAADAHAQHRAATEASVRILEQTLHGAVARGSRAHADYLAAVAEGMAKKLQLQHSALLAATHAPEMETAVAAAAADLEREAAVLRRRAREAHERLDEYRLAGALEGLVREYAEIRRESERVQADVARLERSGE